MNDAFSIVLWLLLGAFLMSLVTIPNIIDLEHRLEIVKIQRDLVNELLIDYHDCTKSIFSDNEFKTHKCDDIIRGLSR